jgi:hypothetical protein
MNGQDFDKVVAPIRELIAKKGQDYNTKVQLTDYFPFGAVSYVQMIHLKSTRLRSLIEQKGPPNFDSIKDTLQDLIAYTTFYLHWLELEELKKLQAHSAVARQSTLPGIPTESYIGGK